MADIDTPESLLATVVDSIDGFEQVSAGVESARIEAAFVEAERREDHIGGKFQRAANDDTLSTAVRRAIPGIATRIVAGHDRIRDAKHGVRA